MLLNQDRAVELMQKHDVDALIATSRTNVTYFSDFSFWSDALPREYMVRPGASDDPSLQFLALLPKQGKPALVVPFVCAAKAQISWVQDVYTFGKASLFDPPLALQPGEKHPFLRAEFPSSPIRSLVEELVHVLRERGLAAARIGIELAGLRPEFRAHLKEALPHAALLDCTNLLRLLRMVKSRDELAALARAASIGERVGMEVLASARLGERLGEMAQRFAVGTAELGAASEHFTLGVYGLGISDAPDYILAKEDVLFADWGCIYRHVYSDTGTTLAMRELDPPLETKYHALRACIEAGRAQLKPGATTLSVHSAMVQALASYGLPDLAPQGHGLGLEFKEYPIIAPPNDLLIRDDCIAVPSDLPLEAGMVINLEVPVFVPGDASLHTEQSFVITDAGCELLAAQDRRRPVSPTASTTVAFEYDGRPFH